MSSPLTLLDEESPTPDPLAGTTIGSCGIVGALVPGKPSALLAFKLDLGGASEVVLLHKLDDAGPGPASILADAEAAAGLRESHLERVFGVETSEQGNYWVTEYVPGATLDEIRAACKQSGTSLPMGFGLAAVADAALGLHELHSRQNPRDALTPRAHGLIRPQHIVVTFGGSAKLLNPRYLKIPSKVSADDEWFTGNAGYLAPEVINGSPVDARADVFSLAVLVYELMTNKVLFAGRTPRERAEATLRGAQVPPSKLNLSLSPHVDDAVMRALSLDPGQRYANAGDFHRALKQPVGQYMWKEAQRAELMTRLFSTRARQTQALAGRMKEHEAAAITRAADEKRAAENARIAAAEAQATAEAAARLAQQQAQQAAQLAAQQAATAAKARAEASAAAAKAAARKPLLRIAIGAVPAVLLLGVIGWFALKSPPPQPPVVAPPPVPVVVAPPLATDSGSPEADAGSSEDAGVAEASDGGADASLDGGAAKKKKKKPSGPPLPPWLRR
ncbi:MAG: protein kinase [Archangiaceae bacterium]|nr:protein kinase [Archangiaceae bacterium]